MDLSEGINCQSQNIQIIENQNEASIFMNAAYLNKN